MPIQERHYKKGAILWMENSKAMPYFFILKTGQLQQYLRLMETEEVTDLSAGDTFGLIGCLTGHNYLDRLIAVEDSAVIMIKDQELIPFLSKKPEIFIKIVSDYSNRLRRINQKLFQLCSPSLYADLPDHFLDIAVFYKTHKNWKNALYALTRYRDAGDNPTMKAQVEQEIRALENEPGNTANYPERLGDRL